MARRLMKRSFLAFAITRRILWFPWGGRFYKSVHSRHPTKKKKKTKRPDLLVAPDPPGDVPPELLRAMVATKKKKSDHSLDVTWLGCNEAPNVTAVVGITKSMLTLNTRLKTHYSAAHAFTRFVARTQFAAKHPEYYEVFAKPFFEATVVGAWKLATSPTNKVKPSATDFCRSNLSLVVSVLPKLALEKVLGIKVGDYTPVQKELGELKHNAFKDVLCAIADSRCPDISANAADASMKIIVDTLPYFVRHSVSGGSDDSEAKILFGLDALKAKCNDAEEKVSSGETIEKADVAMFETFLSRAQG